MPHISSNAARSTSVDVSYSVCVLRLLVHHTLVYCYSRYELNFFVTVQLIK